MQLRSERGVQPGKDHDEVELEVEDRDFGEFEAVQRDRAAFDLSAWRRAVAARERMQPFNLAALDPGPEVVRRPGRRRAQFLTDAGNEAASVVQGRAPGSSLGLVVSAEVRLRAGRASSTFGTLVLPITEAAAKDVDPRSLHLFRWDVDAKQYRLVPASGFNLDHGYAWARIHAPGWYGVFGLPSVSLMDLTSDVEIIRASHLLLILVRLFSPTGPWSCLGPRHLSCCIFDLALDPSNTDRLYAAASDGGVWRLDSIAAYPGVTWAPLTDHQPLLAINCVAVSPANSQVVYYADRAGMLYRSANRGDAWSLTSGTSLGNVWRLLAHPADANTLYAASDRGIWYSTTGGATWTASRSQTTLRDGDFTDAAFDPADPSIIYAGQRSTGLIKSMDGGSHWTVMLDWSAADAPTSTMIKVAVGGQGSDATRMVAVKFDQEVFVNRRGGRPLTMLGGGPWLSKGKNGGNGYGDWCHVIAVDPFDDNVILAGAQQVYRTANGGDMWSLVINYYGPHEDQHRLLFDPTQHNVVFAANDGGVFRSSDDGVTWQTSGDDLAERRDLTLDLITAQFFTAGISRDHAIGDAYHQGLLGADSLAARDWEGIEGHSWEFANVSGDPLRPGVFYVLGGTLFRREFPSASSTPLTEIASFRPLCLAIDERTGSQVALVSTAGEVRRTSDITAVAPVWTVMPGLALSSDAVVSMAFAPTLGQRAYALTGGGRVFMCADADGMAGWTEAHVLPTFGRAITVSADNADHVYAISPSEVYRSVDAGGTWTPVIGTSPHTLPPGLDLRGIAAGPGALYVAASSGVFTSPDEGQNWFPFSDGLPNVEIKELLWTENDLFAVTHGRGLWHHGRYESVVVPPIAHKPDLHWIIELWRAIHGGDPGPDEVRKRIGKGYPPAAKIRPHSSHAM